MARDKLPLEGTSKFAERSDGKLRKGDNRIAVVPPSRNRLRFAGRFRPPLEEVIRLFSALGTESRGVSPSRVFAGMPPHGLGQRIGLFGGSFNPAHEGHRRVSLEALRRLRLDQLWWVVTPGNPLKDTRRLPPLDLRMRAAAAVAAHPRIVVTGLEAKLRTRFTADLIRTLTEAEPATRFVWIMGSDNLAQFHHWDRWRDIAEAVPIAVVNRPSTLATGLASPSAQALSAWRIDEADAAVLPTRRPPAWTFLNGPRSASSSTALRAAS